MVIINIDPHQFVSRFHVHRGVGHSGRQALAKVGLEKAFSSFLAPIAHRNAPKISLSVVSRHASGKIMLVPVGKRTARPSPLAQAS